MELIVGMVLSSPGTCRLDKLCSRVYDDSKGEEEDWRGNEAKAIGKLHAADHRSKSDASESLRTA